MRLAQLGAEMGVGEVLRRGGLTLVSRFSCLLPLWSALGCAQTFRLEPRHTRQVVAEYRATGQLELAAGSKRWVITPFQRARLRLHSDTCVLGQNEPASDADCGRLEGRLRDADVVGDSLYLSPHPPLKLASIDELELIVDGDRAPERTEPSQRSRAPAADRGAAPTRTQTSSAASRRRTQLWGVQVGGSGYAQVSFRWAFVRYLQLELGAFALAPELVANGSAGLLVELPLWDGWAAYGGAGGGFGLVAGPGEQEPCGKPIEECPYLHSHESTEFWYGRVGVAKYFTWVKEHRVGVDAGFWRGVWREGEPDRSESFLWPMAGVSYHVAL